MEYIELFILLLIIFLLIFNIYYKIKIKKETHMTVSQVQYFVHKYKLSKDKIQYKKFFRMIAFINSIIISFVSSLVMYMDIVWKANYFIELLVGFILLLMLIYALYEIYGRQLNKKWGKK